MSVIYFFENNECCDSNTNIVNLKQTNYKAAWLSGRVQGRYLTGVGSIPGHAKYFIFWKYFSDFGKNTFEKALLFRSKSESYSFVIL